MSARSSGAPSSAPLHINLQDPTSGDVTYGLGQARITRDTAAPPAARRAESVFRSRVGELAITASSPRWPRLRASTWVYRHLSAYVLKPLITRAGDYRWLCRTLLAEQSATYECPAPARIRGSEHDALKRLVVDAAKKFAASVGVDTADDQRFKAAQRARVDD